MPYSLLLCLLVLSPSGPNNPRRRPSLDIPRPPETCPNPAFRCLVTNGRSENGTGAQKPPKNAPSVMDVPVQLPVTRRATPIKTLSRLSSPKIRSKIRSHVSSLTSSSFLAPNTPLRRATSNRPDALNRKRTGIPNDPPSPSPCSITPRTTKHHRESADWNKRQPGTKRTCKCINPLQAITTSCPYSAKKPG